MQITDLIIPENISVLDAMRRIDETGRAVLFIAPGGRLTGIVTDGDIRRYIINGGDLTGEVGKMANRSPKSLPVEMRGEAKKLLKDNVISAVPLLDKQGRLQDIIFADGMDVDMPKQADIPVVIMAGGLGTRLYPYTKILPKPLIPVGELPIVEHIINRFNDIGCNRFIMVVNYKKNMIKSYFTDLQKDYEVEYADEDIPLGTGGGLSLLKGKINTSFFLTNCDILIDADLGDIYKFHKKNGNAITLVCAVKHFTIPYGVIEMGDNGEIANIKEKPEMNFLTNTGVYILEPEIIDALPDNTPLPFTDIIDTARKNGKKVGVYPVSENSWMDMGQIEELDNMRRRMENQNS